MKSKHIPTNINKEKENIAKLHKQIKYYVNVRNELNHNVEGIIQSLTSAPAHRLSSIPVTENTNSYIPGTNSVPGLMKVLSDVMIP